MLKILKQKLKYLNFRLIIWLVALTSLGIVVIASATDYGSDYKKQILGMAIGIAGMLVISMINYSWILKYFWVVYLFAIGILGAVIILGHDSHGATRWIKFGSAFTIQPSEFAKICMLVVWAWMYGVKKWLDKWKTFLLSVLISVIPIFLVFKEPDLSTTVVFVAMFLVAMYIGGLSYKKIGICIGIIAPICIFLILYIQSPNQKLLDSYQIKRINDFLYGESGDDGKYQQENSVLAIGSGGLYGKGLFNDSTDSVKNGNYLAEAETDFVFAVVGEEMGFLGSIVIIGLIILITVECIITGVRAPDIAGRIICFGMASIMTFQTFINLGVATDILPNTGITLPFVSSGLSSLIAFYGGMGLVLSVRIKKKVNLEESIRSEYRIDST